MTKTNTLAPLARLEPLKRMQHMGRDISQADLQLRHSYISPLNA